jgi:hypothetical protein
VNDTFADMSFLNHLALFGPANVDKFDSYTSTCSIVVKTGRDDVGPKMEITFAPSIALFVNIQLKKMNTNPQACLFPFLNSFSGQHHRATAYLSATVMPRDTLNSAFLKGIVRPESAA